MLCEFLKGYCGRIMSTCGYAFMPSKIEKLATSQFVERSPLFALGALSLLAIALIVSPLVSRRLLQQGISVAPGTTVKLDPVQPRKSPFGALRIDSVAQLPANTWSSFEVQVYDTQDNLLASAIKQAWSASGTWQEDGESGVWSEQDLAGQFDIRRSTLESPIVVAISLLDQGRTDGQAWSEPVTFRVSIWDGAIDTRFLWAGTLGSLVLSLMALLAVKGTGTNVIYKHINDSDVSDRQTFGGADTLIRFIIKVWADETCPAKLTAHLVIRDSYGELVYRQQLPLKMAKQRQKEEEDIATGSYTLDMILEPAGSYGVSVEVMPDGPVDYTELLVKQGIRTLVPTEITRIQTATG
jgi:hypothetical protein